MIDGKSGFVFEDYTSSALHDAIRRAIGAYRDRSKWQKMMLYDMGLDYSWNASAKEYVELYEKALDKVLAKV